MSYVPTLKTFHALLGAAATAAPPAANLLSATGVLTVGTGAVSTVYSVTGLPFQPKIVFLSVSGGDTIGTAGADDINGGFGCAISTSSRRCIAVQMDSGAGTTATDSVERDDACVAVLNTSGAIIALADFNGFTSDGFGLIVDDQFPVDFHVQWWALGGAGVTDPFMDVLTEPGATGTQNITGPGYTPTVAVIFGCDATAANTPAGDAPFMIGIAAGAGQGVVSFKSDDARGTSTAQHYKRDDEIIAGFEVSAASPGGSFVIDARAAFTGFTATGFDLSWTERTARARRYIYVTWRGTATWTVGSGTIANALAVAATHTQTGVGFEPTTGMMLMQVSPESTADTPENHAVISIGAFSGTSSQTSVGWMDEHNLGTSECGNLTENDVVIMRSRTDGNAPHRFTITATASDGFTLTHASGASAMQNANFFIFLVGKP